MSTNPSADPKASPTWSTVVGWIGIAAQVLVGGFLTLVSGLVAPTWGILVIGLAEALILIAGIRFIGIRWPLAVLPVAGYVAWKAILFAGEAFFGWAP
jgi:hypothetical protein